MISRNTLIRRTGPVGRITLNRPTALNALTFQMVLDITETLERWAVDDAVEKVLIVGCPGRAFCAGGDIRALYDAGQHGEFQFVRNFWAAEFRLNALIAKYKKPIISIVDGLVMGDGVGIASHASHRIMTENAVFALPECSIGLIPDIGSSFLLSKAPGHIGEYVALTGLRLTAADCLYAGFCDYSVAGTRLSDLIGQLVREPGLTALDNFSEPAKGSCLESQRQNINFVFQGATLAEIHERLSTLTGDWTQETIANLSKGAPLSLLVALETVRSARHHQTLEMALRDEYRFVSRAAEIGEFLEGARAAVIDKDRAPQWAYPNIDDVPTAELFQFRTRAPGGDLNLQQAAVA